MADAADTGAVPCPVCAHVGSTQLGEKGGHEYRRCDGCRLIFAPRLPTPEQFAEAYGKYRARPRFIPRKAMKLAPMVLACRIRRLFRGDRGPVRFLDIGANTGYNTEAVRRLGCEAHGLEYNGDAVAYARENYPRCSFHQGEIADLLETDLDFDLIYCSEVIEHVPDPHAFMDAIDRLSNPSTLLFLTTPDSGHFKVPDDILSWKEVIPVEHLRLFDRDNLAMLIEQHGYRYGFTLPMLRANQRHYCVRKS